MLYAAPHADLCAVWDAIPLQVYVPMFVEIHKKIMETPIGWQTGL